MDALLVERLRCPRCGPGSTLVLLATRVHDRRVHEGELGCPNCRDAFPIRAGVPDLRAPPRGPLPKPDPVVDDEGVRLAALLGLTDPAGYVVALGLSLLGARSLADAAPGIEVLCIGPPDDAPPERAGVTSLVARPGLPLRDGAVRGVVMGSADPSSLAEAVRVIGPSGRLVALGATDAFQRQAADSGLATLLLEEGYYVGALPGPRGPSRGRPLPVVD